MSVTAIIKAASLSGGGLFNLEYKRVSKDLLEVDICFGGVQSFSIENSSSVKAQSCTMVVNSFYLRYSAPFSPSIGTNVSRQFVDGTQAH